MKLINARKNGEYKDISALGFEITPEDKLEGGKSYHALNLPKNSLITGVIGVVGTNHNGGQIKLRIHKAGHELHSMSLTSEVDEIDPDDITANAESLTEASFVTQGGLEVEVKTANDFTEGSIRFVFELARYTLSTGKLNDVDPRVAITVEAPDLPML